MTVEPSSRGQGDERLRPVIEANFAAMSRDNHVRVDRIFGALMLLQWAAAVAAVLVVSPYTWIGERNELHPHFVMAIVGGGLLASLPVALAVVCPGHLATRLVMSISQAMFSAMFIHLSGGRIETHFHVFGSLAFLAAYRDWRVLVPMTAITALDHLARGLWWPQSVFGAATVSQWRWLEHAAWVLFEDVVLLITIRQNVHEMHNRAWQGAKLDEAVQVAAANERRFRAGFDQAAVGICYLDADGGFIRANACFCSIAGYTPRELTGRRFEDLTHSEDTFRDREAVRRLLDREVDHVDYEKRCLHKAGYVVWVRVTVSRIRGERQTADQLLAVVQDVSDAKRARQLLEASYEEIRKLSLVASKTRHSVIIGDADGTIEWVNEGFTRLTGYTAAEVLGARPGRLLQGELTDTATQERIRERLRAGQSVSEEILNYSKDGRAYWIDLRVDPVFDESGEVTQFIATQTDITERKENTERLQKATEAAEAANRAKSQFLANMSHEIRTPLNGILGFTEVLLRSPDAEERERQDYLKTILNSGRHLLTLINDILDLSKIEAGQLTIERIACSPHDVLAEAISILRVPAAEKGIGLEYSWDPRTPQRVVTDPVRLKQLLMNLIGNAVKFTDQGGVKVSAHFELRAEKPTLTIQVRDSGVGIPPDKLETIFRPFTQADDSVTRRFGGTGLGLAICRSIAEALGGERSVESTLGEGSVFTVRIEVAPANEPATSGRPDPRSPSPVASTAAALGAFAACGVEPGSQARRDIGLAGSPVDSNAPANARPPIDLGGLRVLVVDDGETNRKLISIQLRRVNALVSTAEHGGAAVDRVAGGRFDVILMDMQMPVMDGYTATRTLRQRGFAGPIIALTANAMHGDRQKCEAVGCSGYLTKPINADELIAALDGVAKVLRGAAVYSSEPSRRAAEPKPRRLGQQPSAAAPQGPYRSSLPTDDPEIREIVVEFVERLGEKIDAMVEALAAEDYESLAKLAHWLKGAGGTVGFDCFTNPAATLEEQSLARDAHLALSMIETVAAIRGQISV